MSVLSEIVNLSLTAASTGITRQGFGVGGMISYSVAWTERTRSYGSLLDVSADFASTTPEYRAARAYFSQSPHPQSLVIGRGTLKPTQKYQLNVASVAASTPYSMNVVGDGVTASTVTVTTTANDLNITLITNAADSFTVVAHGMATGDGPYRYSTGTTLPTGLAVDTDYWIIRLTADTFSLASSKANALALTAINITSDGVGTQTLRRVQNDVICAQLKQALGAVVGANYTVVQIAGAGETDYLEITVNAAGNWLSLEVAKVALLKIQQTHADPGIATDLDAIALENSDWYALLTNFNSNAMVLAAAAWIEAQAKIYLVDVNESDAATTVVTNSDTLDDLHTLTYNRTAGAYHPSPANFFSAAWAGRVLPLDPGSETWKFKQLTGVAATALTSTQRTNLRARKANFYETVAGVNVTVDGTIAGGSYGFVDVTRGLDWLEDDMTKGVFGAFVNSQKIPYTNAGLAIIRSEVKASLKRAADRGIISSDFVITMPLLANISDSDKALRKLPDVKFEATLQGAIHQIFIFGTVSV